MGDIQYIVGQLLSIVAVVLGFISYQMKTPKGVITFQIITAFVFSVHYLMIGVMPAMALNFLSGINSVFFYIREKRGSKSLIVPLYVITSVIVTSLMTWDGWYSALIMVGLVVGAISLAVSDTQKTRVCMLIKSPLCLIYNIIVFSTGGIIYECAVLVSSVLGLVRNRKAEIAK